MPGLPGYDAWKLDNPYDEAEREEEREERRRAREDMADEMLEVERDESYE